MDIQDAVANFSATDVTIVTTTENVAITTPLMRIRRNSAIVMVVGWGILTTGAGTTSVVPRIRRGTGITDTLVTTADAKTISAAAGSNEQFIIVAFEQLTAEQNVQYSFCLLQNAATGNGTVLVSGIMAIAV